MPSPSLRLPPCFFIAASCVALLVVPSIAHAGCLNLCEITAEPVLVEPPLSCGTIELSGADDCNCGVFVRFQNPCAAAMVAVDFEFGEHCTTMPELLVDGRCARVPPHGSSAYSILIDELGETRETLTVRDADGEHTVTVVAHVSEFWEAGICTCATVGRQRGWLGWGAALGALGFAGLGWRRRRGRRRRGDRGARARARPEWGRTSGELY